MEKPARLSESPHRFTLGHFLNKIEGQSGGKIRADDFTPIPCPDLRCGAIMYALFNREDIAPLNRLVEKSKLLDLYADLPDWENVIHEIYLRGTSSCGRAACCTDALAPLEQVFRHPDFFAVGYHGMMDAYTFYLDRARRCCVHALLPDGRLIPFCLYNIKHRGN